MTTATDAVKGTVSSVTDALGHTGSYTYDSLRRVTKTSALLDAQEVKTEYEYDTADRLGHAAHNNTSTKQAA